MFPKIMVPGTPQSSILIGFPFQVPLFLETSIWTPKPYLKHQTSGGIWKTRVRDNGGQESLNKAIFPPGGHLYGWDLGGVVDSDQKL